MSEEQLILLVKNRPILYDRKNPDYRQIELKDAIWKEIAAELRISEIKCRTKWKALRDQFLREVKRKNYNQGDDVEIKWKHFYHLEFLLEKYYPRKSFSIKTENQSLPTTKRLAASKSLKQLNNSDPELPLEDYFDKSCNDKKDTSFSSSAPTTKKRKFAKESIVKGSKRSLIQVQTTTSVPDITDDEIKPIDTSTNIVMESRRSNTPNQQQFKIETEDDGMDMFFQSVKRTIRNINFTQMELLDLQMSILQTIREKIFQKNGSQ